MKILHYTGIGSRETPPDMIALIKKIAAYLRSRGYVLRSGGAPGADSAFESEAGDAKQIFIPWGRFNGSKSYLYPPDEKAFEIAAGIHPAWDRCSDAAKKLHARNVHQILGANLNDPSEFVVCWTENGECKGGTATAMRLAVKCGIPVYNLGSSTGLFELKRRMKS